MCIGESGNDTLNGAEQEILSTARFTAYTVELRDNEDGVTWATLTPKNAGDVLPEITICRVDPCILVMLEDRHARRQFRSLGTVEETLAFVHDVVSDDAFGTRTLH